MAFEPLPSPADTRLRKSRRVSLLSVTSSDEEDGGASIPEDLAYGYDEEDLESSKSSSLIEGYLTNSERGLVLRDPKPITEKTLSNLKDPEHNVTVRASTSAIEETSLNHEYLANPERGVVLKNSKFNPKEQDPKSVEATTKKTNQTRNTGQITAAAVFTDTNREWDIVMGPLDLSIYPSTHHKVLTVLSQMIQIVNPYFGRDTYIKARRASLRCCFTLLYMASEPFLIQRYDIYTRRLLMKGVLDRWTLFTSAFETDFTGMYCIMQSSIAHAITRQTALDHSPSSDEDVHNWILLNIHPGLLKFVSWYRKTLYSTGRMKKMWKEQLPFLRQLPRAAYRWLDAVPLQQPSFVPVSLGAELGPDVAVMAPMPQYSTILVHSGAPGMQMLDDLFYHIKRDLESLDPIMPAPGVRLSPAVVEEENTNQYGALLDQWRRGQFDGFVGGFVERLERALEV